MTASRFGRVSGPVFVAGCAALAVVVFSVALVIVTRHNAEQAARAEAIAVAAQRVNAAQTELRRELVRKFARSDRRLCIQIEALKTQIRVTVHVDDEEFLAQLAQIGIAPGSDQARALLAAAHAREQDTLERFAPLNCGALPKG